MYTKTGYNTPQYNLSHQETLSLQVVSNTLTAALGGDLGRGEVNLCAWGAAWDCSHSLLNHSSLLDFFQLLCGSLGSKRGLLGDGVGGEWDGVGDGG